MMCYKIALMVGQHQFRPFEAFTSSDEPYIVDDSMPVNKCRLTCRIFHTSSC
jgi:hypothetical protein